MKARGSALTTPGGIGWQGSRPLSMLGPSLPQATAQRLREANFHTLRDVLVRSPQELVELLDALSPSEVASLVSLVADGACPAPRTASEVCEAEEQPGRRRPVPTGLAPLDALLGGGVQPGRVTEVVGPAGAGKTQLCLGLCAHAVAAASVGGAGGGGVIYVDAEGKFSAGRLAEMIGALFPEAYGFGPPSGEAARRAAREEAVGKVYVVTPRSIAELLGALEAAEVRAIDARACLVIVDSMACLARLEFPGGARDTLVRRNLMLGHTAARLKVLAESLDLAVVVTNQIMGMPGTTTRDQGLGELDWKPALGYQWAHAVNARLLLDHNHASGHGRGHGAGVGTLTVAKSSVSPRVRFRYSVEVRGVQLEEGSGVDADARAYEDWNRRTKKA